MKPGLSLFFSFLLLSSSCSSQYGITKAKAYVRGNVAGTIRTKDNGQPQSSGISITHLIYIETHANQPQPEWKSAWVEGRVYSIRPVEVKQEVHLGQTKKGEEVLLKPEPDKQLWQLVLFPAQPAVPDSTVVKAIQKNLVVLTGLWKNKPFHFAIKKIQPLESIFGQ